jgi:hypothetical protein
MMWLIEGTLVIIAALLIVLIVCKCKDCLDKCNGDNS